MYIGIDCGTQGTKVVICDSDAGRVVASGYSPHELISSAGGQREQQVEWWMSALKSALQQAMSRAAVDPASIRGIAVSGQQHGMVLLDAQDNPLHPAKLWCDTQTANENQELIEMLGGEKAVLERLGIQLQTGYTASKILWFSRNYPDKYRHIAKIMLPHDYLNYRMTGEFRSEYGDASGTGYLDVRERCFDAEVFALVAPGLDPDTVLPELIRADQPHGYLTEAAAEELGLVPGILVASGGGDNMMGAIGTGNIAAGTVTMSLGTSGTLYAYSNEPVQAQDSMIAGFCSSTNGWLPLICTMNVTAATSMIQKLLELDIPAFSECLEKTRPGADGVAVLPFFNGERIPPLPKAQASIHGLNASNTSQENIVRATTEAATFTLRYGLDLFRKQGIEPAQIRLIGGGARSALWRQMVADIMNVPVICPEEPEAAALGAAIQAMWCDSLCQDSLEQLCRKWVALDSTTLASPEAESVAAYEQAYQRYLGFLEQVYGIA